MGWPAGWLLNLANGLLAQDNTVDLEKFQSAYDNLLWGIVVAGRDQLAELVALLYEQPYHKLPPSLQVAALRLYGLEPPIDLQRLQAAAAGIALYCTPGEEAGACAGIRALEQASAGSTDQKGLTAD